MIKLELSGHSHHLRLVEAIESGDLQLADQTARNYIRTEADKIEESSAV